MALNKNVSDLLRPNKASQTAQSLFQPIVQTGSTRKKEIQLQLRIEEDSLKLFKEICEANGRSMSECLRHYISEICAGGEIHTEMSVQNVPTEADIIERRANGARAGGKLALRNKTEREQWLKDFRTWGVWLEVPELGSTYYRYDFVNGCSVIVEVSAEYYSSWATETKKEYPKRRYSLITPDQPKFSGQDSISSLIEWLTKNAHFI